MEKIFNLQTAESVRKQVRHRTESEQHVPDNLLEADFVNIKPRGLVDMDFDGESLFALHGYEGQT